MLTSDADTVCVIMCVFDFNILDHFRVGSSPLGCARAQRVYYDLAEDKTAVALLNPCWLVSSQLMECML